MVGGHRAKQIALGRQRDQAGTLAKYRHRDIEDLS
jgi:hypothetical protein